jgi:1-acyl-sn-glycerol-3-phosphate acyltransferase
MTYTIAKTICAVFLKFFIRIEYKGKENIPKSGGFILSPNHISNLDPPAVGVGIKRDVYFMAKKELFKLKVIGRFLKAINAYPVDRHKIDKETIKTTLNLLRDGKIVGIFPEGTRSKTNELGTFHTGAAMFAKKTGTNVIPVAISGKYGLFKKVTVQYGEPIDMNSFETIEEATESIKDTIDKMRKS